MFLAIVLASSALVMFIVAFNRVVKGYLGQAVAAGLLAVVLSGAAVAFAA